MAIDESGEWWRGEEFADLDQYIRLLTEDGYPADVIVQARCACGHVVFRLAADQEEGCARRTCLACGASAFICDSDEIWEEAEPEEVTCPCGRDSFEIGVGFSLVKGSQDVRWVTVGQRCTACGVLASYVDWKISYGPSAHLLAKA